MKVSKKIMTVLVVVVLSVSLFAGLKPATPEQVAKVTMSACALAKNIQTLESVDIYVLGDKKVAKEMEKYEGWKVGDLTIKSVKSGNTLPGFRPQILVCGKNADVEEVKNYCRKNHVLSIGAAPNSCEKGLSLSMYQKFDRGNSNSLSPVKLMLNLEASLYEEVYWDKSISLVADNLSSMDYYVHGEL